MERVELPVIITPDIIRDPTRLAKALGRNFQKLQGERADDLTDRVKKLEAKPEPEHEDDEDDPTQVTGAAFYAFWAEKHHHDIKWYAESRWDELTATNFHVVRYKVRLWRWDMSESVPGTIPDGMPSASPSGGYVKKFPVGHPKAGEYMPPRVKNVETKDNDANLFAKTEWSGLRKDATYAFDVRAISKHGHRGGWSTTSAVGTASDTTAPPSPYAVYIDVDQHRIHVDVDYKDKDGNNCETTDLDRHPDIAHARIWISTDAAGTNIVTKPNGKQLFDRFVHGSRRTFRIRKPGTTNYYAHAQCVDGSGNISVKTSSSAGNKSDPPTPTSAPTVSELDGGRRLVRLKAVAPIYGTGTYGDDDLNKIQFLYTENGTEEHTKTRHIDNSDLGGTITVNFKHVKEGTTYDIKYRFIDTKGHKSGWSPSATGTADDPSTPPVPGTVTVDNDPRRVHVEFPEHTDEEKKDISHYEFQISTNNFASIAKQDLTVKANHKSFKVPKNSGPYKGRARTVGKGGNKSGYSTSSGTTSAGRWDADDLNDGIIDYAKLEGTVGSSRYGTYASMIAASAKAGDTWIATTTSGGTTYASLGLPSHVYRYSGSAWTDAMDGSVLAADTVTGNHIVGGAIDGFDISGVSIRTASSGTYIRLGPGFVTNQDAIQFFKTTGGAILGQISSDATGIGDLSLRGLADVVIDTVPAGGTQIIIGAGNTEDVIINPYDGVKIAASGGSVGFFGATPVTKRTDPTNHSVTSGTDNDGNARAKINDILGILRAYNLI